MQRLRHIFRLGLKELTSLRHDSVLVLFLLYAFTVAVYMPSKGSVVGEVRNASVAFVDEDDSALSRRLAELLRAPEFQKVHYLRASQMDNALDSGRYTFVIDVPPHFHRDLLAGLQPQIQVNVDATAMSQAFIGAGYIQSIFNRELQALAPQQASALQLVSRVLYNSNTNGGWFMAVIQIVIQITILAILLTGTAILREREHGTLEHLLVLPLTALEIMLAKLWSNALVVVLCTWASLEWVIRGLIGVPLAGSTAFFLLITACYLFAATSIGIFLATLARSIPQFGLLSIPVIMPMVLLAGGVTPLDSMPHWLQNVLQLSPTTHYVNLSTAVLFRDAGPQLVWVELLELLAIGAAFFGLALARFRRTMTG